MKTLDEVIKAVEMCTTCPEDDEMCPGCPYADEQGNPQCVGQDKEDALHYLKELQKMTDIPMEYFENGGTSQELRNTSQITCPKCHSVFEILDDPDGDRQQLLKCQALLQDFYRNDPLTWDELKSMEGKPVWVEYNLHLCKEAHSRMWIIIQEIFPWQHDNELIYYSGFVFGKKELGESWQAYRKERE